MRKWALLMVTILVAGALAGCLGGGDDSDSNEIEYVTAFGIISTQGSVTSQESTDPVPVTETIDLSFPVENLTMISITIIVEDDSADNSDAETRPDDVSGTIEDAGGEGFNETLQEGQTPYQTTITINSREDQSLPANWKLILDVTCNPSDDNWPGPLIISVSPDNGFSYNVTVDYKYLTPVTG